VKQKSLLLIAIIIVVAILGATGAYYLGTQNRRSTSQQTPSPTSSPIPATEPQPTETAQETNIPPNWLTYKNSEYGFEISYPENFQALDDQENLYGWPKGVVLLYGGGQSYDIAIEAWDSQSEYESKYPSNDLVVNKIGDKYITVADITKEEENTEIISTFKITD